MNPVPRWRIAAAVLVLAALLGFGILLHHTSALGDELILYVVGVTWLGETAAYFVGSAVGRHKLAPSVSPGKTSRNPLTALIFIVGVRVLGANCLGS